jgi:predicted AAA+ superfamily ATPase
MAEAVENVLYRPPVTGTSTDNPNIVEGNVSTGSDSVLLTADMTTRQLLSEILIELKKINLRQEEVFEEIVNDGDV